MAARTSVSPLRQSWVDLRPVVPTAILIDLIHKSLGVIVIAPIVAIIFRLFLAMAGRNVLADEDILRFVLSPVGFATTVIVGALVAGATAFEQASLLTLLGASCDRRTPTVRSVLWYAIQRLRGIVSVCGRFIALTLTAAIPFVLIALIVYRLMLSRYDINYYLQERPPEFLMTLGIGGMLVTLLLVTLLPLIAARSLSLPIVVYERTSGAVAMQQSIERTRGHRWFFARWLIVWGIFNLLVSSFATLIVSTTAILTVRWTLHSTQLAILAVGIGLLLSLVSNALVTLVAHCTSASMLAYLYGRCATEPQAEAADADSAVAKDGYLVELPERGGVMFRWNRYTLGSLFAGSTLVAIGMGVAFVQAMPTDDHTLVIAHRGASAVAPENTLAAIQAAIDAQADWVEFDVQESADGIVVVAHDSDLKKLGGDGTKIWEGTAAELRKIDIGTWFGADFADQRLPTLEEVLQLCQNRIGVTIELKYYGHNRQLERRVLQLVRKYHMDSSTIVISLKQDLIRKFKQLEPSVPVGLLTAKSIGSLRRVEADILAVNGSLATPQFVRDVHRSGRQVFVWTINDPLQAGRYIGMGVDGIITDDPAMVRRVLAERQELTTLEKVLLGFAARIDAKLPAAKLPAVQ
jgi:glycerophosphoryl diester phosphodiesterase